MKKIRLFFKGSLVVLCLGFANLASAQHDLDVTNNTGCSIDVLWYSDAYSCSPILTNTQTVGPGFTIVITNINLGNVYQVDLGWNSTIFVNLGDGLGTCGGSAPTSASGTLGGGVWPCANGRMMNFYPATSTRNARLTIN